MQDLHLKELPTLLKKFNPKSSLLLFNIRKEMIKRYKNGGVSLVELIRGLATLPACRSGNDYGVSLILQQKPAPQLQNLVDKLALMVNSSEPEHFRLH